MRILASLAAQMGRAQARWCVSLASYRLPLSLFALLVAAATGAIGFGQAKPAIKPNAPPVEPKVLSAWVELTAAGPSIRAIVDGGSCPVVKVEFQRRQMLLRQQVSSAFPVTVCELGAPRFARTVHIGDKALRLTPGRLRRIVVFGDTGCRLQGANIQDCNDEKKWPFAAIMRNAAAKHPDLAIHVGDYHYRETACPAGNTECAGSPHGDAWASWDVDFFRPSAPLLAAAPWVFARGNHEQCTRGADGWFRMLDAGPAPLTCPAMAAPFNLDLPGLDLKVIDTADMADLQLGPQKVVFYQSQLDKTPKPVSILGGERKPEWIVTHRPIWGFELTTTGEAALAQNKAMARVVGHLDRPAMPQLPEAEMVLSGHVHFFAVLSFGPLRPVQLITGDGGTALEQADTRSGEQQIDGLQTQFTVRDTYGYMLLEREKQGWTGKLYGANDEVLTVCEFQGRTAHCSPPPK